MEVNESTREVRVEVAYNVRHLGGYETRGGQRTNGQDIIRSGGLQRLTEAGATRLRECGIRTVVDLRSSAERERDATPDLQRFGIETVTAPVFEQDASPVGMAGEFPGFATVYRSMLESGRMAYRTLFEVIADAPGGVLFHCAAGKDRTGIAAALLLDLAEVRHTDIVADYEQSAGLLSPLLPEWLPRMKERGVNAETAAALMASEAEDIEDTLAYVRGRWGSAAGYLEDVGVSLDAMLAVRGRMSGSR